MTRTPYAIALLALLAACGPEQAAAPAEAPPSFAAESAAPAIVESAAPAQTASVAAPPSAAPSAKPPVAAAAATPPAPAGDPALAGLPAAFRTADLANGQKVFAQCRACHLIEAGAGNRIGPNLHNVYGRKAGEVADFVYSPAMKDSGVTWTAAELDRFLADPKTAIAGNKMTYLGIRQPENRRDLVAYLAIESKK